MSNYNPFNPLMQEYIFKKLTSLNSEQLRCLSAYESFNIFKNHKNLLKYIKSKNPFSLLSTLTKVGIKWGIYIVDKDFKMSEYESFKANKDFVNDSKKIRETMLASNSFLTNSKQFSIIESMLVNSYHGKDVVWDRRFVDISNRINRKLKTELDSYSILSNEGNYKQASEGSRILMSLFSNLPRLTLICKQNGININDFIILNNLAKEPNKYFTWDEIKGMSVKSSTLNLVKYKFIDEYKKTYNISTKGIIFTSKITSTLLDSIELL